MLHLIGKKFGKLLVIERLENYKYQCLCEDCGTYIEVYVWNLTSGKTKSCGCKRGFKPRFVINTDIKSGITFYDVAVDWLYTIKMPLLSATTIANYEDMINFFSCFWQIPIKAFTQTNCIPIVAYFAQDKYSYDYASRNYSFLYNVFNHAVQKNLISQNPMKNIPKIRKRAKKDTHTIWTYNQYLQFSDTFDLDTPKDVIMYTFFSIMFLGGLRKEEVAALSPAHVDLDNSIIVIDQAWEYKVKCMGIPKSPNSYRTIKICNDLHKILKYYFSYFNVDKTAKNFLFTRKKDFSEPVSATSLRNSLIKHQKLAHLPNLSVHELRHSHVVMLLKDVKADDIGMIYAIAAHIGDTPATTMKWYMHATHNENEIAESLNNYINKNKS